MSMPWREGLGYDTRQLNAIALRPLLRGGDRYRVFTSDVKGAVSPVRYVYPDASISCDG